MGGFDENPIIELGKNPLPGENPCGIDASDDEQYILIDSEMGKLDRIEADEPDWYQMEQACTNLLRSKTKDVEVAAA
ncbi:MAG: type VI secretion system ImpA family N-terminal domain-containing protein, partial [Phycisphaerae bacterium]|nr:type VI secretion system ImpA family N-terminal domain-containing protein [Phycisphaerae bacterium]